MEPLAIYWEEGRLPDVLRVKASRRPAGARAIAGLPDWYEIVSPDAEVIGSELLADPSVERAFLAFAPMPPPGDLDPPTADFRSLQTWLDASPGLGFDEARRWPGGDGGYVQIADIEYGWDPLHEDLESTVGAAAWGLDTETYVFHGNSVLGQLVGTVNGYGVDGGAPGASALVISPYTEEGRYDIAAAIVGATELLRPGDVLLIEQQSMANGYYCPVSIDPAVFEAIARAVSAGIVVVEPGGNGGQDLDDPVWEGWWAQDSGSILVGGGQSPAGSAPRTWESGGSSYGSRVDLQGWYDGIVTASGGDYDGHYADLYYPNDDGRQAYTQSFGGTSGASPMIAAMAAVAQSVAIATTGEPWSPLDLRAALIATGTPQRGEEPIGPQPDLRRLLRTYFVP